MVTQRALLKALGSLLNKGFDGSQTAIRQELRSMGLDVSQSTISRALQRMGARRAMVHRGSVRYETSTARESVAYSPLHDVQALVTKVLANEVLLIVRTRPGSASLVAAHIDGLNSRDILGSIAGDDTVFVAPRSTKDMARAKARLVALLDRQSLV